MTTTTSAVRAAAQQAVSANPDADTRTQVIAALRALGIEPLPENPACVLRRPENND